MPRGLIWPLRAVLLVVGVAVLAASAHIAFPGRPVPTTMQTGVVLLVGAAYGTGLAEATVGAYLVAGFCGLPVFAGGGGIAYLTSPTLGYLIGFLAAASLVGAAASRGWMRGWGSTVLSFLAGQAVIFICGLCWLSLSVGARKAVTLGLMPFLPSEATNLVMAVLLYRAGVMLKSL